MWYGEVNANTWDWKIANNGLSFDPYESLPCKREPVTACAIFLGHIDQCDPKRFRQTRVKMTRGQCKIFWVFGIIHCDN